MKKIVYENRINKCIGYVRTAEESDFAVENQIRSIKYYANSNNLDVINIFIDNGYAGTNFKRPGFKQMQSYINNNNVDILLVKSIDRISRNITDFSEFYERLKKLGIKVYTTDNENIDIIDNIFED